MTKIQKALLVTSFLLLAIYLSSYQTKETLSLNDSSKSIKHLIQHDTLVRKFMALKSNQLLLEIIPVKESDDLSKDDFSLLISFLDPREGAIDPMNKKKKKETDEFQKKAANYVSYMKHKRIPQNEVPWGYYVMLDKKHLGLKNNVVVNYSPVEQEVTYALDSCRYPPGCYMTMSYDYVVIDSACKVPPGCPWETQASSSRTSIIKDLVKKQYSTRVNKSTQKP